MCRKIGISDDVGRRFRRPFAGKPKWHMRIVRALDWVISVIVLDYYFKTDRDIYGVSLRHAKWCIALRDRGD